MLRKRVAMLAVAGAALLAAAPAAQADLSIVPGSFTADAFAVDGAVETQAGAHPFRGTTGFTFERTPDNHVSGSLKDAHVQLPRGFVGNPEATSKCSRAAIGNMASSNGTMRLCPPDSQVGMADVDLRYYGAVSTLATPIYNVEAAPGVAGSFAFIIQSVPVYLSASVNTAGDYELMVDSVNTSQSLGLYRVSTTFWGVPNDSSHDAQRHCGGQYPTGSPCPVDAPRVPFLTNPSECGAALNASLSANSWQRPDVFEHAAYSPAPVTGCERLRFAPTADLQPTATAPDTPTGLKVRFTLPQGDDVQTGLAPPPLRDVTVDLPEGMTVNPGSANGLEACSDAQLGLKSDAPIACPDASKLGTARAETPVLTTPLTGSVYLRSQASDDPASGEMFRLALVLENAERGILVKLPGQVRADAATGRLTAVFRDNPQLPVGRVELSFKSGPRAPLATPPTCGAKSIGSTLTSWAGHSVALGNGFAVPCTPGLGSFSPSVNAGTTRPIGGAFSPLALTLAKPDGNAPVSGLRMTLPTGLLAKLKGNLGSQVGSVTAYAGSGTDPFALPGQVYLEGAYGDAPYSLKVVVPAKAGPFDLGEVVVRQKVYVDPVDAHVTVVSDPIPTVVKGVPVRLQRLDVNVDKPDFIVNPSSCAEKQIAGQLAAVDGQTAAFSVRFQVSDCGSLKLAPKLKLALTGKKQLTDRKHPGFKAVLTQGAGQAGLKRVSVALPLSLALDPKNADSDGLCSFEESRKADPKCPASAVVGRAKAWTPLLERPIEGPVFFAKNVRKDKRTGRQIRTLPSLVMPLRGEVSLNLIGDSEVKGGKLVNTFAAVPDAPVSRFELTLRGGRKGILIVNGSACRRDRTAVVEVDGQNNKAADQKPVIAAPCGKAAERKSKR